ncbi:GH39 family glycosyl hydrolase [Oceanirhabdus sp. W0125-5]|uniref:GH39 family glycosyl hydrolase n=1 Tax=Oceanirhabdus sp. W0125-5 TaxID=2999116 RepID=UPI0022F2F910|nr:helix-turn-helix domain-containing protein [Oceanirhabdus sp. W0125-5]WBW97467.1 helix-turn-helix domain-containing protein [Oceanirhabdus sp. W0125-5]
MEKHELFDHRGDLPFYFKILNKSQYQMAWHKEIEIILVLEGTLNITLGDETYTLKSNDFFLINSNEGHSITQADENSIILSLSLDTLFFKKHYPKLLETYIDCKCFFTKEKNKKYEFVRHCIAKMLSILHEKNDYYQFYLLKESLTLLEYLLCNFKKDYHNANKSFNRPALNRLKRILNYIDNNYTQKITLSDIASLEYISIYYLSKLFKEHLGIGFHEYLNQYRLNKSMNDLLNTNKNIIDIALDNGFPNAKSYTKIFKEKYKLTPDVFRKNLTPTNSFTDNISLTLSDYAQNVIEQFIKEQEIHINKDSIKTSSIDIDTNKTLGKYNSFHKILHFDLAYDNLNTNWQYNLQKIQSEIKFDYIKLSGIFTEGMYFYNKEDNLYNWFNIDILLDFFIKIGLKPYIELYYTSKKYTLKTWHILLEKFISHCIDRYGITEVETWKFELSGENRSYENSIDLYTKTLNIIEKKFKTLKLGILFVPASNFEERYFLINFKNRKLDFMSIEMTHEAYIKKKRLVKSLINNIKKMNLKPYFIKTETTHYLNDSCFKASQLVNEILNDFQDANRQVSFIDNLKSSKMFYGGLGILTYNGLKKPIYNAYFLLSKLTGEIVAKDKNYIVLKQDNKLQILLYNSSENEDHYNLNFQQYLSAKEILVDKNKKIKLNLDLDKGLYKFKYYTLCSERGSIFDAWTKIASPNILTEEDAQYLTYKEQLDINIKTLHINNTATIEEFLGNDTIKLIEIEGIH